ncbi:MAG TPA: protein kinase, partial [Gemmatimonadales bacterium]|nr:protein kinase [Gemmatimonadales bacterium]
EFLVRACAGDDALLREVESLLQSDRAAGTFCETPAAQLLADHSSAPPVPPPAPRLPPGTRLGAYEITSFLAAGGMGDVYRASHTVLGRQVAVKTVGAAFSEESARRRLVREAQHASRLKHPGICTIYEVGEAEDGPFIVMEYLDGQSLRDLLREGVPELNVALDLGIQVAAALGHAHEHGIVHRDMKSSNVMVDRLGRAVILDFGLSRRIPGVDEENSTRTSAVTLPGALAGTPSHMAPEALLGGDADVRSDIWALGVLLYELVTGELPFRGRTPYEMTSAILSEPIEPICRSAPLALRLVIERCLMKEPRSRYQRVAEVAAALDAIRRRHAWPLVGPLLVSVRRRSILWHAGVVLGGVAMLLAGAGLWRWVGEGRPPRITTMALLPLANATGNPAEQYYADGVTEALNAQLGAAADVRIISPASAALVARTAKTPAEIAHRLGASVIVEGSVHRIADRVLVDVRLVRPADGHVLWSESFQRPPDEVLSLQADVVRALVLEVRLALRTGARERLTAVRSVDPDVYEAYLKGRYEWNQRTGASLERAIAHFRHAVELDPTYAPAHAALADCYSQLATVLVGIGSPREYRPRAAAEAIKALQLDPSSAEAHAALGYVRHYDWQWVEAERAFQRALELNPSYPLAHLWYANLLMSLGRMDEALAHVRAAHDLDPFSLIVNTNVGWVLSASGQHQEAAQQLRHTLELDSTYLQARWRLADALLAMGQVSAAREQVQRLLTATNASPSALALLASVETAAGRPDSARIILRGLVDRSRTEYVPAYLIAERYRALGDDDQGVRWLTRAVEERSNGVAYMRGDTAGFGRDPRYGAIMARVGLP